MLKIESSNIKKDFFIFKTAQNSKNLRLNGHTSFEFQTRNLRFFYIFNIL